MEFTFKLKPWQAAIFCFFLSILLFSASYFKFSKAYADSKEGVDAILIMLKSRVAQRNMEEIKNLDPYKDKKAFETAARHTVGELDFKLISYDMRASFMGDMVFRIEYKVGDDYPDGEKYHYYQIPYSVTTGWDIIETYRVQKADFDMALWRK